MLITTLNTCERVVKYFCVLLNNRILTGEKVGFSPYLPAGYAVR
jgi:hypothetical protein